jgi:hypothetical protein
MFSATTKKSFIIENAADACDILEEAINIAFGSGDQELKMMVRIIEEEIQF